MTTRGWMFARLVPLCLALACADDPSSPPGALIGRFGAPGGEINLSADLVDVRFGCGLFHAAGPVIPDGAGRFVVELTPRPGNQSESATISGLTDGATIEADVTIRYEGGEGTSRFSLRKGVEPDYLFLSCTVPTG